MLVLSRKKNESLCIGGGASQLPLITVVIVEIRGDKVRLGVEAPSDIPVHRREVYEAINRQLSAQFEAQVAAGTSPMPRPATTGLTG